jgi:hypothetical protein
MQHFEISDLAQMEGLNLLCGGKLGEGSTRTVFRNAFDPKLVVKVATSTAGVKANMEEFAVWESVQYVSKINSFFAACHTISQVGSVLIQEYVPDVPAGSYKIPAFFTDLKAENFGLVVGKQVVCRDYGLNLLREQGMKAKMINWTVA